MTYRLNKQLAVVAAALAFGGCAPDEERDDDHGPMAEGIYARLGDPLPGLSAERTMQFERGLEVALRGFLPSDGLGPAFNVASCVACHEKPVIGGGAGLYRNFVLAGTTLGDGTFLPADSAGPAGSVLRVYNYDLEAEARPPVDSEVNTFGQRNPIPFFGVGLIAELSNEELLKREDVDDEDGDGISGKANFDRGFVGRFGRKSQTVSIEGFIRGPLFNHLGLTSDPLDEEQKAALPVDSSGSAGLLPGEDASFDFRQAAAPETSLIDDDGVEDPELSTDDLFHLVAFAMLTAAPKPEKLSEEGLRGRAVFNDLNCGACHAPRLDGPRGPLPIYSDLLLHDMGPELADGLVQKLATGSEFRTQPLWGIAPVGPYLHDGRASTLGEAILLHGGEAEASRDAAAELSTEDFDALVEFIESLGGRDQRSQGLLPPPNEDEVPGAGEYGGPTESLTGEALAQFERGRIMFDREFGLAEGAGGPRMNGDSCRACHFEPTIGGAGPVDVNVMRHGILNDDGEFTEPVVGTILHKNSALLSQAVEAQEDCDVFEHRQTPGLFGLGLMDQIPDDVILANADPDDSLTPDGITGRASYTDGGRLGRFGWKAQIPSVAEFVRDGVSTELGLTLPWVEGLDFGKVHDNDDIPDPELSLAEAGDLEFYLLNLGPPPRTGDIGDPLVVQGEEVFGTVGCANCHIPELDSPAGAVPLYSDLLLHEILPEDAVGIEEVSANVREFRTPPLWGIATTAPYMHNGRPETIEDAILAHDGEAVDTRQAFEDLPQAERDALLAFLQTL